MYTLCLLTALASSGNQIVTASPECAVHRPIPQVDRLWAPAAKQSVDIQALHGEYRNIFKYGNRNAASHLWSAFVLHRSSQLTTENLIKLFTGFCAISGSPTRPSDYNRYGVRLPLVPDYVHCPEPSDARNVFGYMYYCCWPCVCDTTDFLFVDTKTVVTRDHPEGKRMHFVVLGNPCEKEEALDVPFYQPFDGRRTTLRREAAEVRCNADKELEGAVVSDHGYIIIGMLFEAELIEPEQEKGLVAQGAKDTSRGTMSTHPETGRMFQDYFSYQSTCESRAAAGYNSGMGEIFRKVAEVNPIPRPEKSENLQIKDELGQESTKWE